MYSNEEVSQLPKRKKIYLPSRTESGSLKIKKLSTLKKKLLLERWKKSLPDGCELPLPDSGQPLDKDDSSKGYLFIVNYMDANDLYDAEELNEITNDLIELIQPYGTIYQILFSENKSILRVTYNTVMQATMACDHINGLVVGGAELCAWVTSIAHKKWLSKSAPQSVSVSPSSGEGVDEEVEGIDEITLKNTYKNSFVGDSAIVDNVLMQGSGNSTNSIVHAPPSARIYEVRLLNFVPNDVVPDFTGLKVPCVFQYKPESDDSPYSNTCTAIGRQVKELVSTHCANASAITLSPNEPDTCECLDSVEIVSPDNISNKKYKACTGTVIHRSRYNHQLGLAPVDVSESAGSLAGRSCEKVFNVDKEYTAVDLLCGDSSIDILGILVELFEHYQQQTYNLWYGCTRLGSNIVMEEPTKKIQGVVINLTPSRPLENSSATNSRMLPGGYRVGVRLLKFVDASSDLMTLPLSDYRPPQLQRSRATLGNAATDPDVLEEYEEMVQDVVSILEINAGIRLCSSATMDDSGGSVGCMRYEAIVFSTSTKEKGAPHASSETATSTPITHSDDNCNNESSTCKLANKSPAPSGLDALIVLESLSDCHTLMKMLTESENSRGIVLSGNVLQAEIVYFPLAFANDVVDNSYDGPILNSDPLVQVVSGITMIPLFCSYKEITHSLILQMPTPLSAADSALASKSVLKTSMGATMETTSSVSSKKNLLHSILSVLSDKSAQDFLRCVTKVYIVNPEAEKSSSVLDTSSEMAGNSLITLLKCTNATAALDICLTFDQMPLQGAAVMASVFIPLTKYKNKMKSSVQDSESTAKLAVTDGGLVNADADGESNTSDSNPTPVVKEKKRKGLKSIWQKQLVSKYVEASSHPRLPKHAETHKTTGALPSTTKLNQTVYAIANSQVPLKKSVTYNSTLGSPDIKSPDVILQQVKKATTELDAVIKQLVYLLASVQRVYTQVQTSTETNARITIPSTLPSVKDDSKASGTNNKAEEDCNWIVLGLKQVLREVKKGGVKLVLLAPDTETSSELDKQLATLASACFDRNVPILYALSRRVLGKAVLTGLRQAAVAITNIDCTSIQPVNIHPPIPNPPVYPYKGLSLSAYYSIVYNQLLTVPPSTLADAFGLRNVPFNCNNVHAVRQNGGLSLSQYVGHLFEMAVASAN